MSENYNTTLLLSNLHDGSLGLSIVSLFCCIAVLLLILVNKTLRTLTYNFLICIFISEIIGNIGIICEKEDIYNNLLCNKGSLFLIPFSDISTMMLFCFFSYCSIELIKKRNNKIKTNKFFIISFLIATIYSSIIFAFLLHLEDDNKRFYFHEESKIEIIRYIHVGILVCLTCYIFYNIVIVIQFLKEKQKSDRILSWKLAKLIKILFRFPIICFSYWIFYLLNIPLSYFAKNLKITLIIKVFSVSFFNLRGFLIFLNTIKTDKVEILLNKIIEINIKHNLLLKFNLLSKRKRRTTSNNNIFIAENKIGKENPE